MPIKQEEKHPGFIKMETFYTGSKAKTNKRVEKQIRKDQEIKDKRGNGSNPIYKVMDKRGNGSNPETNVMVKRGSGSMHNSKIADKRGNGSSHNPVDRTDD